MHETLGISGIIRVGGRVRGARDATLHGFQRAANIPLQFTDDAEAHMGMRVLRRGHDRAAAGHLGKVERTLMSDDIIEQMEPAAVGTGPVEQGNGFSDIRNL